MVLLGMGQEWSIHLAKRFQAELVEGGIEQALLETFLSTGRSILTSGFTTSTGMVVLAFSSFRGFAEYGVISASSMLMIFVAMFTVMPATLVMGTRMRLIRAQRPMSRALALVPPGWATGLLGAAVAAAAALTWFGLRFDYDFASLKADVPSAQEVKRRHRQVYPGFSAPAAAFVARDLPSLDSALGFLEQSRRAERDRAEALIGTISSVRTLVPAEEEALRRRTILRELQDRMQGRWVRRVKDPDKRRWIEDIRDFKPPERFPRISDLPDELHRNLVARDGSGGLILAVDIVSQKNNDGRAAMAFARELRKIDAGEALLGPTGDKLVLAEILTLVTGEGPGLVGFTFLGISVLVLLDRRGSLVDAFWILVPLVSGIILTLGVAVGLGWKLNFFNMVILPSLIGMTVDNGVHAYRRWQELGQDTRAMHTELLEPLTGSAFTTIIGYAGMTFAHHQGLRTIGSLAVLGLLCCWVTGVALMPGILRIREVWSQPSTLDRASSDTPMDSDHSEVPS
jgi:predicted exporter